ncbi:MAG: CAP domain-containing protein [Elusimicrobiota bacterium]|jgi:uncharacterized protein YkwD|nr:CAP domain-containing protein [Elusimicrobiota bacterium]
MVVKVKFVLFAGLLLTCLMVGNAEAQNNAETVAATAETGVYKPNIENIKSKIIDYINELRKLNGVTPLAQDEKAMKVAQKRADYQTDGSLTHTGLLEALKEIKDPIYGTENLAYVHPDSYDSDDSLAKGVINLWYVDEGIKNKGHHKQMLNPIYDFTGVGLKVASDGYFYISQVIFSDEDVAPETISIETANEINDFYNYFESNKVRKSVPLK